MSAAPHSSEAAARVCIIDDEEGIRFSLRGILEDEGYQVLEAGSAEEGLALIAGEAVDLVFLDIWLPGMDGLAALDKIQQTNPSLPVLMISGHGTIETAVTAIKKGAYDYIEKPLSLEKVVLAAQRALEFQALKRENQALRTRSPLRTEFSGNSPEAVALREQIAKVAPLDTWVLITGENGTGKEITARSLHAKSRRSDKPLVAVNCAAIPEELIESELFGHEKGAFTGADSAKTGKFELAHEGTLFLDEIGDMSLKTQAKILRILQEQRFERVGGNRTIHVDVRVIAATNKNLENAIAGGTFREDLYYRLRVFPLVVPPLRERGDDVIPLLHEFVGELCREHGLAPFTPTEEALAAIRAYSWPGNVRELRNFVERSLILYGGQTMTTGMLPPEFRNRGVQEARPAGGGQGKACPEGFLSMEEFSGADFKSARAIFENRFLAVKLQEYGGNITRLAEGIGLERSYLHRKLKSLGINTPHE
ncbi:Nitrogen assimilation regulatory protein NtrX [uncultured delta proteobacterium]|uniref:Nitrogen assimilation regulatory protein NtrX n=1 Tax=uncultured delta proteobacterium TaxID=34034 RepID=A0A212JHS3_9DELT|nr:Nitrogen assimilation regulatory protein NtrX [uncultured delta proteobacterium]